MATERKYSPCNDNLAKTNKNKLIKFCKMRKGRKCVIVQEEINLYFI